MRYNSELIKNRAFFFLFAPFSVVPFLGMLFMALGGIIVLIGISVLGDRGPGYETTTYSVKLSEEVLNGMPFEPEEQKIKELLGSMTFSCKKRTDTGEVLSCTR